MNREVSGPLSGFPAQQHILFWTCRRSIQEGFQSRSYHRKRTGFEVGHKGDLCLAWEMYRRHNLISNEECDRVIVRLQRNLEGKFQKGDEEEDTERLLAPHAQQQVRLQHTHTHTLPANTAVQRSEACSKLLDCLWDGNSAGSSVPRRTTPCYRRGPLLAATDGESSDSDHSLSLRCLSCCFL